MSAARPFRGRASPMADTAAAAWPRGLAHSAGEAT
jgi:hypothetical protein